MANINDFKLLALKCKKYFDLLDKALEIHSKDLNETSKERFGFYLYMLENICGIKDILDLTELITDSEFNLKVFNKKFEDYGIDAIQINEDEQQINLFNFKYREKFKPGEKQSINETILSTKFINALVNGNVTGLTGNLKEQAKEIIKNLINTKDVWKLSLYVISNDSNELDKYDGSLIQLQELYDLEVIPFGLSKISKLMSIRPKPISARLIVDEDAIMSFSENQISTSKSYVFRLHNSEVVRITSSQKTLREQYNIEDLSQLSDANLDFSVLFDNVRGLVIKSKYNPNILKTLKEEPSKFFMYNNGITMTAQNIEAKSVNVGKKVILELKDFQVVNGGQTLRSIHDFNKEDKENVNNFLAKSQVMIRVFKTTSDEPLTNKIAEYTNSQNSISNVDLKSLSAEQIHLEEYLDEHKIIYARKTGDTGLSDSKNYELKISMERFGQILLSLNGFPEKATNQKKHIFGKYYDQLFGEKNLKISDSPQQIRKYFEIKNAYENNLKGYESNDQKVFYILYLQKHLSKNIPKLIDKFESVLRKFVPDSDKELSDARKLLLLRFKEFLDKKLKII